MSRSAATITNIIISKLRSSRRLVAAKLETTRSRHFQEPILYGDTIRYNILYGCEEWATDDDMIEAAKLANAHDFILSFEAGYDTRCGEKGVQMSGVSGRVALGALAAENVLL